MQEFRSYWIKIRVAIERALVSGSMAMLVMKLLSEKDMYGYEMIDTLRQKSQNVFELKAGTLYPLLHSLEEKGLLTVYEQDVAGKTRKYYSLTRQGRGFLEKILIVFFIASSSSPVIT